MFGLDSCANSEIKEVDRPTKSLTNKQTDRQINKQRTFGTSRWETERRNHNHTNMMF